MRMYLPAFYFPKAFGINRFILTTVMIFSTVFATAQCYPVFDSSNEDITTSCEEPIPDFSSCTASSLCCPGPVSVTTFSSETGAIVHDCIINSAYGPGQDWAFWLPDLGLPSVAWHFIGDGHLQVYEDGTGHLWGVIANAADNSLQWQVDMRLHNGKNWTDWSALGRAYKNDLGYAGTNYLDWMYYELVPGFANLSGLGALAGSHLQLHHQPVDFFYGFQMGVGANNKNGNDGFSGWFTYNGVYNGNNVTGHGDVNVDENCLDGNPNCAETVYTQICRAEDACNNVAFQSQSIYVTDNIPPVVDAYEETITIPCDSAINNFITATDACSVVLITYNDEIIIPGCGGQLIRHYTVADGCANSTTADQTIYLLSEGEPEFTVFPIDTLLNCNEFDLLPEPDVEWISTCSNTTLNVTQDTIPGDCPGNYTIERHYILTDDCENSVTQTWTINVQDITPPQFFDVPFDIQISCGAPIPSALPFVIDNCDLEPNLSLSATTVPLACGYNFIRTWVAIDHCGNTDSVSQTIRVNDSVDPLYTFLPPDVTVSCDAGFVLDTALVMDVCSNVELTWTDVPLGDCAGSYIRLWRAYDGCGNQALESTTVTLIDTVAPNMTVFPDDLIVSCEEIPVVELNSIQYTDNCGSVTKSYVQTIDEGDCPNDYTLIRTWTLTDGCNNSSVWVWEIQVIDTIAPTLLGVPENTELNCGDPVSQAVVSAIDNCGADALVSMSADTVQNSCGYDFIRTWTATDSCGNTVSDSQTISFTDNANPVFTFVPGTLNLTCDGTANSELEMAVASDDCSIVTVTFQDEIGADGCAGGFTRLWIATDGCNNVAEAEQIINVSDSQAPVITSFPSNASVSCSAVPTAESAGVTFSDDCGNVSTLYLETREDGNCPNSYTLMRHWTFTDACGNAVDSTWTIYVVDEEGPTIFGVPDDVTLFCGDNLEVANVFATDNCSPADSIVISLNATTQFFTCGKLFTRTWTATDECNASSTAVQLVTYLDNEEPIFTFVPGPINIACGESEAGEPIESAIATDDCSLVTVTYEDLFNGGGCAGGFIRRWTATDGCNNSITADQQVSSNDSQPPVITSFPEDVSEGCSTVPSIESAVLSFTDDCGNVDTTFVETREDGVCAGSYTLFRTWTFADGCNNTIDSTWTIYVVDEVGPVISGVPQNITITCGQTLADDNVTAVDNCSASAIIMDTLDIDDCAGSYTRRWTATDACGNITEATQTVTVIDNIDPVPDFIPVTMNVLCGEEPQFDETYLTFTDNCSDVTVTFLLDTLSFLCSGTRNLLYSWIGEDACGNRTTVDLHVNVLDNQPPQLLIIPENYSLECGDAVPEAEELSAQDNCGNVIVNSTDTMNYLECGNVLNRTFLISDDCGNSIIHVQTIFFQDNTPPVFSAIEDTLYYPCEETLPEIVFPLAIDACSGNVNVSAEDVIVDGICPSNYTIERTFTALDACGLTTTFLQIIIVSDQTEHDFLNFSNEISVACTESNGVFLSANDECSTVSITYADMPFADDCAGGLTRTYTATDACGNVATAIQVMNLTDNAVPEFIQSTLPAAEITVNCDEVPAQDGYAIEYFDDCSNVNIEVDDDTLPGTCPNRYTITRTWTISDNCGNSADASSIIHVEDNQAPILFGVPDDITLDCLDPTPIADVFAIDNCSEGLGLTVALQATEEIIGCQRFFTRRWTATDACGNDTLDVQVITFSDLFPPVLSDYPADIVLDCGDQIPPMPVLTATDNCSGSVEVIPTSDEELNNPNCNTITRTWCATDCIGLEECHTQIITFNNNIPAANPDLRAWQASANDVIIRTQANSDARWNIDVYDITGRKVNGLFSGDMKKGDQRQTTWDISNLKDAVYLICFTNGQERFTKSIAIIR